MSFEKGCKGKKRHTTLSAAQEHMNSLIADNRAKDSSLLSVYSCFWCGNYHVGHSTQKAVEDVVGLRKHIRNLERELVLAKSPDYPRIIANLNASVQNKDKEIKDLRERVAELNEELSQAEESIKKCNTLRKAVHRLITKGRINSILFWLFMRWNRGVLPVPLVRQIYKLKEPQID